MSTMESWAQYYRQQGLSVIPVSGKVPLIKWAKYQEEIASEEEIKQWWGQWPEAGIGLVCGRISKLFVLDIDGPAGQDSCKGFYIPPTVSTRTKRGFQYYFRYPQGFQGKTTLAGLLPGVDTRGDGGYVKGVPSTYSDNSGRYEWINDLNTTPAECPEWLLKLLEENNKPREINKEAGESWLKEKLDGLSNGNRNSTFTAIAGSLRSRGYSADDIYLFLEGRARDVSFDSEELRGICTSVASYAPRIQQTSEAQSVSDFLKDEQKVDWIVPGLIAKRSIGFIAGLPETSKTWAMMDLAIEVAKGGGLWLGKFPVNAGKVLFIDQERFKGETQRRFKALLATKELKLDLLNTSLNIICGSTTRLNMQHSFEAFRKVLLELSPTLVVIDSWATFHTASENDRTEVQKVLELIKSLREEIGCTFMFINHEGKSVLHHEPGEVKTPNAADMMGSMAIPAAAELVLTVRRKDAESCVVYTTKNTLAQKIEPFCVSVVDVEDGIQVRGS